MLISIHIIEKNIAGKLYPLVLSHLVINSRLASDMVLLTLNMAEANGKLAEFWDLPEDLLSDEMNTSVLWPEVDLGLKPAGADLDAAVGGGHVCAGVNCARQTGEGGWRGREDPNSS